MLIGRTQHVHWAGHLGLGMQRGAQDGLGLGTDAGQGQPGGFQRVGSQRGRPARVGHNGDTIACGQRLEGQSQRAVEEFSHALYLDHAGLPASRTEGRVAARQRAGMRSGGRLPAGRPAGFECEHRLAKSGPAQRIHECRPALDILQVKRDDLADLVRRQEWDDVGLVDVGFVPHAEEAAEPDPAAHSPVYDAAAQRPGLGQEGDPTARRHALDEGRVQGRVGVNHPDAIRPHDAHPIAPGDRNHLRLPRGAFGADLAESS